MKLDHALVALDLSSSQTELVDAMPYFRQFDTDRFTLFTYVPILSRQFLSLKKRGQLIKKIEECRDFLREQGYSANRVVKYGLSRDASRAILREGKERGIHWIITGNRSHNKIHERFVGRTSVKVLQDSHIPVMLLNLNSEQNNKDSAGAETDVRNALFHLLHPTDFSDNSGRAFAAMKQLIAQKTKSVTLVHVDSKSRPEGVKPEKVLSSTARIKKLRELSEKLNYPEHLKVYLKMPEGEPARELINLANELNFTLMVMAVRGKKDRNLKFSQSISYQVARNCKLPILFIPAESNH